MNRNLMAAERLRDMIIQHSRAASLLPEEAKRWAKFLAAAVETINYYEHPPDES